MILKLAAVILMRRKEEKIFSKVVRGVWHTILLKNLQILIHHEVYFTNTKMFGVKN